MTQVNKWNNTEGLKVLISKILNVAVSASHVILSCDYGKFSVVYSNIDHINTVEVGCSKPVSVGVASVGIFVL